MRAWVSISAVLICAIVATSCSGGGPANPSGDNTVTINVLGQRGNASFSPNPAEVGGRNVVFKNLDTETHRVVLNDGTIDTGDIAPGATSRVVTMPGAGANYHCSLHDNMGGAVIPSGGGTPPPCEGIYCY